jgi:hypothetical protein
VIVLSKLELHGALFVTYNVRENLLFNLILKSVHNMPIGANLKLNKLTE